MVCTSECPSLRLTTRIGTPDSKQRSGVAVPKLVRRPLCRHLPGQIAVEPVDQVVDTVGLTRREPRLALEIDEDTGGVEVVGGQVRTGSHNCHSYSP